MSEEIRKQVVGVSFKDNIRIKEDGVIWAELEYMMMSSQLVGSSLVTFLIFLWQNTQQTQFKEELYNLAQSFSEQC